ncbi:MAG TPA: M23 family metallopeptidase [Chloroflexota bacterium]|nr:M23 family metallopeptidase [Chloroflexota bacterium]
MIYPLQHINEANPLQGGYDWLSWTDGGVTPHPGLDFNAGAGANADRGFDVYAAACGWLRWKGWSSGYGNHVWLEHPNGHWSHYCHLDAPAFPAIDEWVEREQHIADCGASGGTWPAHLHFEALPRRPQTWEQWPLRWAVASVEAAYHNPWTWLRDVAPALTTPTPGKDDDMALTPDQQTILDAALRQTAAGNTIANGGDLDWWLGTWHQLASDKESLAQLLTKAQGETNAQAAEVARLQALLAAPGTPTALEVEAVEVRLSGGKSVVLAR